MHNLYDVIIIGGGPAGLTASLYLARAKYRTLILEKEKFGGQITITHEVVNYPGVEYTSGAELTETMRRQAENFGVEFQLAEVEGLELSGDVKTVRTSRGELKAFGVLLATGASPRMVGFKGEADFRGRGVAYCATCDGEFFTGKEVFVVGGGFAAAEEAVFLTKYARHVHILIRKEDFSCAKSVADSAKNHPKITVHTNTEVEEVVGDSVLRAIRYRNNKTGETTEYRDPQGDNIGVFVFAGYAPATGLVKGIADLNEQGYVLTDGSMKTSVDGLYAAGDVCVKALRQVVTAVGDGALAATELEKYAAAMQQKTGLRPRKAEPQKPKAQPVRQADAGSSDFFDADTVAQLNSMFSRMENDLILRVQTDDRPISGELKTMMEELAKLTDRLSVEVIEDGEAAPCVKMYRKDGSFTGIGFHGVPGGHEFTSFVMSLYNAAGPGQALEPFVRETILRLKKTDLKVLVSLSCTMCPELVMAAQRIAAVNPQVTAEVFDVMHFPQLREQYNVMSVPCLVVNDGETVTFGKKNLQQLLDILQ